MTTYDYLVIGGGIVGFSTAMHLLRAYPGARVALIEKEKAPAQHQTGRNSGVIHSGIYYKPGSFKARFARDGATSMVEFCREHGLPHRICGKVIVATSDDELPALERLYQRGLENQVPVESIPAERVREIEPHVNCLAGVLVKSTGITDYVQVCHKMQELIEQMGGQVFFGQTVHQIHGNNGQRTVETPNAAYHTKFIINCAGLHSDRVARLAGDHCDAKIVPFRGEYFQLIPEKRSLVNGLIYPVPNPDFPFLGVHFTKMVDGSVHAGPNAVLALKREGYHKTDFNLRDFSETVTFGGFWKLISANLREGMKEMHRSIFKASFVRSLQRLIPEVRSEDLEPCHAGVRAQGLMPDGSLVDDFLLVRGHRTLHVCNAPSPAATAALEIGKHIVNHLS